MESDESSTPKKDLTGLNEIFTQRSAVDFPVTPSNDAPLVENFETLDEIALATEPATAEAPSPETPIQQPQEAQAKDVQASFPFHLKITGPLAPEERARLLDILSRENFGVRELDLEPQFQSEKILIPRISEYAGVLIVQALRSTRATMELFASDLPAPSTPSVEFHSSLADIDPGHDGARAHPAESIPITSEATLPETKTFQVIDMVTASATLDPQSVDKKDSIVYQQTLDALQLELKYKAFRKGANAILNFSIQLIPLSFPTGYRLQLAGSAVKFTSSQQSRAPGASS